MRVKRLWRVRDITNGVHVSDFGLNNTNKSVVLRWFCIPPPISLTWRNQSDYSNWLTLNVEGNVYYTLWTIFSISRCILMYIWRFFGVADWYFGWCIVKRPVILSQGKISEKIIKSPWSEASKNGGKPVIFLSVFSFSLVKLKLLKISLETKVWKLLQGQVVQLYFLNWKTAVVVSYVVWKEFQSSSTPEIWRLWTEIRKSFA